MQVCPGLNKPFKHVLLSTNFTENCFIYINLGRDAIAKVFDFVVNKILSR
jgi:hypothetical protein